MIYIRCSGCGKIILQKEVFFEVTKVSNYNGIALPLTDSVREHYCEECFTGMENNITPQGTKEKI